MTEDQRARALLDRVITAWGDHEAQVLGVLAELTSDVWCANLDRLEPRLGDDAFTLGLQSSKNLCNLAARRLRPMDGVEVRTPNTLEIRHQRRVLHVSKVSARATNWDPYSINWSESDVRTTSAEANSRAYTPTAGTLFEGHGVIPGQPDDPESLRFLHYVWQGFDDGTTRSWLGFPRHDGPAWFAVCSLGERPGRDETGASGGRPGGGRPSSTHEFDTLPEPDLPLQRKAEPAPAVRSGREGRARPSGA